jgi:alkylhydroperoxidase/carboxymuconolactone decarboxylase family protein YurZ
MIMNGFEDTLRSLALHDERVITSILATGPDACGTCIDMRTRALVRLGALIAVGAPVVAYQSCIAMALATGASAQDVMDTLIAVAPIAGEVRLVEAAPALAMAIGYDIDAPLEAYEHGAAPGERG